VSTSFFNTEKTGLAGISCILSILFICICLFPSPSSAAQPDPSEVIRNFNAALLDAMKRADELSYPGRYKLLGPVLRDSFALSFMAAQSAGRYWKTLTDEERSQLIKTYSEWTVATYAARFDGYSGEKFEVASGPAAAQGAATVVSKLIKSNAEEVRFHYLLRKIEGRWRVVDIQISGVSQLALTRAQFAGVLKEKGYKGLISMLKEKIRGFEKGGEK